jgi:hypothetical protein
MCQGLDSSHLAARARSLSSFHVNDFAAPAPRSRPEGAFSYCYLIRGRIIFEDPLVEYRQQEKSEHGGAQQTPDDDRGEWPLHFRASGGRGSHGMKPKLATQAVMSTGRSLRLAPVITACLDGAPDRRN